MCLRYECNLTSVCPNYRKNYVFLDWTSSCSQLCCALSAEDDFECWPAAATKYLYLYTHILAWYMLQITTVIRKKIPLYQSILDSYPARQTSFLFSHFISTANHVPNQCDFWPISEMTAPTWFSWAFWLAWNFACVKQNQTKWEMQMSNLSTDLSQMNWTTGVKAPWNCSEQFWNAA